MQVITSLRNGDPSDADLQACVEALQAHGGNKTQAANSVGLPRQTFLNRLSIAVRRGLMDAPPASPNPPNGMTPIGVSILSNSEGEIQRWEKFKAEDFARQALLEETVKAFVEPLRGKAKAVKAPKASDGDYMVGFPIGDPHIGLYSWREETGHDWDSGIAEEAICQAMDEVIDASPSTQECFIWNLGDWMHVDSDANATAAGTPQDADTRFPKIARTAVRTIRYVTERALRKYQIVNIRNVKGNHDKNAAVILDEALKAFYDAEPRLVVHDSPKPVFIHRWHANLFGVTHGHAPKPDKVPSILATDAPEDWAQAKHKFVHHGHFHQKSRRLFQEMGVDVECHAAATAPDRWTIEQGYRSTSEVKAIVYHKDEGEKQRFISQIKRIGV